MKLDTHENAIEFLIDEIEGGYTKGKNDRGGETKYGISKRSYPQLDIKNLERNEAKRIYKRDFWDACNCDKLPAPIRYMVFDGAVNSGVKQSVKWLQEACNMLGASLVVDGVCGNKTLRVANIYKPKSIKLNIISKRLRFYTGLVNRHPEQIMYLRGWVNRVANIIDNN